MSLFPLQRPGQPQEGPGGATLSEGHEEFIGLLCLPAHELQVDTMVGLGPLSPFSQRQCQMLAMCGWGTPLS